MKTRDYCQFRTGETLDESKREMFDGYPLYQGNENVNNMDPDEAEIKIYGF